MESCAVYMPMTRKSRPALSALNPAGRHFRGMKVSGPALYRRVAGEAKRMLGLPRVSHAQAVHLIEQVGYELCPLDRVDIVAPGGHHGDVVRRGVLLSSTQPGIVHQPDGVWR